MDQLGNFGTTTSASEEVLTELVKAMLTIAARDSGPSPTAIAALLRRIASKIEQQAAN